MELEGTWLQLTWKALERSPAHKAFCPLARGEPELRSPPNDIKTASFVGLGCRRPRGWEHWRAPASLPAEATSGQRLRAPRSPPSGGRQLSPSVALSELGQKTKMRAVSLGGQLTERCSHTPLRAAGPQRRASSPHLDGPALRGRSGVDLPLFLHSWGSSWGFPGLVGRGLRHHQQGRLSASPAPPSRLLPTWDPGALGGGGRGTPWT